MIIWLEKRRVRMVTSYVNVRACMHCIGAFWAMHFA